MIGDGRVCDEGGDVGASLGLRDTEAALIDALLSRPQPNVPDGRWRSMVAKAVAHRRPEAPRLVRLLPAAAGSDHSLPRLEARCATGDGSVTVVLEEDDDGHLLVTVSSASPPLGELMIVRWRVTSRPGLIVDGALATPLASSGGRWLARYDVGSVRGVVEVETGAEVVASVPMASVPDELIRATLHYERFGSAERAWRAVLDDERAPRRLRDLVGEELNG